VQIVTVEAGRCIYGGWKQLGLQFYGCTIAVVWSCIASWIMLKTIDYFWGLRVALEDELTGLDMVCHGEVCSRMLPYAAVCWPVLPHAGPDMVCHGSMYLCMCIYIYVYVTYIHIYIL
jgi:hypothetical protein